MGGEGLRRRSRVADGDEAGEMQAVEDVWWVRGCMGRGMPVRTNECVEVRTKACKAGMAATPQAIEEV